MISQKKYCIHAQNAALHELIGLHAHVIGREDTNKLDLQGRIVNETQYTLELETPGGPKTVPKKEVLLDLDLHGEHAHVNGKDICFRPEDRTKEVARKRKVGA
ncbi:MAG: ribonuclease P protein subunit [Candidatus Diapherotrites archaeon]|nr:ribonuclease P protein subunit [Candidatus Diapherotrites archaeon]